MSIHSGTRAYKRIKRELCNNIKELEDLIENKNIEVCIIRYLSRNMELTIDSEEIKIYTIMEEEKGWSWK